MIKRVAMWRLKSKEKLENANEMKAKLLPTQDRLTSLYSIEVGINTSSSNSSYDIVFIGVFQDQLALEQFEQDAYHQRIAKFVAKICENHVVVDFEC